MLKPSEALTKNLDISTYSLVVGIAKKAREIAVDAEIRGEILTEKPVDLAVQEYMEHDFEIVEAEPCPDCGRLDCICEKAAEEAPAEADPAPEAQADPETEPAAEPEEDGAAEA